MELSVAWRMAAMVYDWRGPLLDRWCRRHPLEAVV